MQWMFKWSTWTMSSRSTYVKDYQASEVTNQFLKINRIMSGATIRCWHTFESHFVLWIICIIMSKPIHREKIATTLFIEWYRFLRESSEATCAMLTSNTLHRLLIFILLPTKEVWRQSQWQHLKYSVNIACHQVHMVDKGNRLTKWI